MAVAYERVVAEDLNTGHGTVTVTNPGGGTMAGNKLNLGRLVSPFTVSFSASPAFDMVDGDFQTITLTADVTASSITISSGALFKGALLFLEIIQDGTGGWTYNWPTNVLGAANFPISTVANDRTLCTLIYNGSNWLFLCAPTISQ